MTDPPAPLRHHWLPAATSQQRKSRRLWLLFLVGLVLALVGALTAWLTLIEPHREVYFLPLGLNQYGQEFPVRCWVRQDLEALAALPWQKRKPIDETFTLQKRELIEEQLHKLADAGGQDLVVYLSAYARSDADGELCLLPVDARIDAPQTWIPLREVFASLRACPAHHKLLLLDIMHPLTDLRRGILANDTAVLLQPLLDELLPQDKALTVLSACSPGQVSLTAEELGQSVFAYQVCRCLSGNAEGATGAARSARVSARALAAYVIKEVDRWAIRHRGVRQTPQLHGAAGTTLPTADFVVMLRDPDTTTEPAPLAEDRPAALSKTWALRDQWWQDGRLRQTRAAFRQLEAALLRAEQQWQGGVRWSSIETDLQTRVRKAEQMRRRTLPDAEPPRSVAEAILQVGKPFPPAGLETAGDGLRQLLRLEAMLAIKQDPVIKQQLVDKTEQWLKKFTSDAVALAWTILEVAGEDRLSATGLRFVAGLLPRDPPFTETTRLRKLAAIPPPANDWQADGIRLTIQCSRAAARADCHDQETLAWVRSALKQATEDWQREEKLLFAPSRKVRERAAADIVRPRDALHAILRQLESIRQARQDGDKAVVLLPTYVGSLEVMARESQGEDSQERLWLGAVADTCKLRAALAEQPAANLAERARQIETIDDLALRLRNEANALDRLRAPLTTKALQDLIRRSVRADLTDLRSMRAWLQTPWPTAPQRQQVWKAWRSAAAGIEDSRDSPPESSAVTAEQGAAIERQRARRRGLWSIELLRLLEQKNLEPLEEALAQATRAPADLARQRQLSSGLDQAWRRWEQALGGSLRLLDENEESP